MKLELKEHISQKTDSSLKSLKANLELNKDIEDTEVKKRVKDMLTLVNKELKARNLS